MCDVCVAENALSTTACGKETCNAFRDGYRIAWSTAPQIDFKRALSTTRATSGRSRRRPKHAPKTKTMSRTLAMLFGLPERATIYVRARGGRGRRGAEGRGEFQIRREGESWPKEWQTTDDLAGAMAMYGLDVKWKYVPKLVQEWATYRTKAMPTLEALNEAFDARIAAREAREGRQPILIRPRRVRVRAHKQARDVRVRHKKHPRHVRVVPKARPERRLDA